MKTRNVFNARFLLLVVLGNLFLYSCRNTMQGVKEDYKNTREDVEDALSRSDEEITAEKQELYAKIAVKKEDIETSIGQLQEDAGEQIQHVIGQLELEKEKLDRQLNKIESTSNETWAQTKDDMEGILEEVSRTVDNLMGGLQSN